MSKNKEYLGLLLYILCTGVETLHYAIQGYSGTREAFAQLNTSFVITVIDGRLNGHGCFCFYMQILALHTILATLK